MQYAQILGTGSYLPANRVTNEDLSKYVETTDEWIVKRTGIEERRVLEDGLATSDMVVEALNDLLKKSSNFDPNNKSNAEKTGLLIKEIADNIDGDRIVKAHLNVFYSADNENDLRTKKNQIVDKFKELDIKTRQPIDNYLNSIFHNSFFCKYSFYTARISFSKN